MSKPSKKPKLFCYVDETGQDTYGKFFIVSVVVTGDVRESLVARLERIEHTSGKGKSKWTAARPSERLAYMTAVLSDPLFKQTLHFAFYENTKKYMAMTVLATAGAILAIRNRIGVSIYVDGLPKSRVQWFATELRHFNIRASKVVGIRREESDALIRLADALAGFVRQALMRTNEQMEVLFERAKKEGYLKGI